MTIGTNDIYAREVVKARADHLISLQQHETERITRILRGCFDPGKMLAPQPTWITLYRASRDAPLQPRDHERWR